MRRHSVWTLLRSDRPPALPPAQAILIDQGMQEKTIKEGVEQAQNAAEAEAGAQTSSQQELAQPEQQQQNIGAATKKPEANVFASWRLSVKRFFTGGKSSGGSRRSLLLAA